MKIWLAGVLLATTAAVACIAFRTSGPVPLAAVSGAACAVPSPAGDQPGMVWVPDGQFMMGADYAYPEEGPAHRQQVAGFWMDQTEVTNAQFAQFVAATGYQTLAERGIIDPAAPETPGIPGSAIFRLVLDDEGQPDPFAGWWRFQQGADWRHPDGPASTIAGLEQHPVVHVAWEDAQAYAHWKGHSLPTEAQFEYAAQGSAPTDASGNYDANTWQGLFPLSNDSLDGHAGTAPAGCYTANAHGLYDLIGNVWEWTDSPYYPGHDFAAKPDYPAGHDPVQPGEPVAVIKGGSFLCAANYCMRYRPEARLGQSRGLGTSHIGFRTVLNP